MSKILKNTEINVGIPFQIKTPLNFHTIKKIDPEDIEDDLDEAIDEPAASSDMERDLERAREEAGLILREAELEAEKILERAQQEAESIHEEARESGYKQGYNLGFDTGHIEGKQSYEGMLIELSQIKDQMDNEYKRLANEAEQDMVEIILGIAKKVISDEVRVNEENIIMLVQKALQKCYNKDKVILRVSPEDEPLLNANREKLLSVAEGIGELEIKVDMALRQGSCSIDTPFGSIDAGVDTQLEGIEEAFKELLLQYTGID